MSHDRSTVVGGDGTAALPAQLLPFSVYASALARQIFVHNFADGAAPPGADLPGLRAFYDRFNDRMLERVRRHYSAEVEEDRIGGVPVLRVRRAGTRPDPARPLVLNLHGGAFAWGRGSGALVESIPLACLGGVEVIAVQYRLAPEHRHPAAAEDVAAAYAGLLQRRPATSIGLFGCSAGAILASQVAARLHALGIAQPGAIAMFSGAGIELDGDSVHLAPPACGETLPALGSAPLKIGATPYFHTAAADDPLVFPYHSDSVLKAFPPTLLLCGSRDFFASSVTAFHRKLLAARAQARLVMFDGLWHAFHIYPDLAESIEANTLLARFFEETLVEAGPAPA